MKRVFMILVNLRFFKRALCMLSLLLPLTAMSLQESLDCSHLKDSIFKISNNEGQAGTGFAIGPNLFVTNAHVIRHIEMFSGDDPKQSSDSILDDPAQNPDSSPASLYFLSNENGDRLAYDTLLFNAKEHDLALFKTKGTVSSYLEIEEDILSTENRSIDYPRSILGYPKGAFTQINQIGKIQTYPKFDFAYSFPTDLRSKGGGASGSPVFNNENCKVIAVLAMGGYDFTAHPNENSVMVIKLEYLQQTINNYKSMNPENVAELL